MSRAAERHDDLKLHLHVLGADHEISARARVGATKLMELLPLARAIAEGVSAIAVEHVLARGERISCKAGCGACCRSLVPISPAEAVRLAQVVEAMPKERRREVKKRFEKAVKRLEEVGLLDARAPRGRAALRSSATDAKEAWEEVSARYFAMGVPCPFLEDESCSIYPERPMVCREFLVTTPASMCSAPSPDIRDVPRPVRMSEVMTEVTNELLGRADPNLPLTLSLEWASAHARAFDHEGDGEELAMELVRCIQDADDAEQR